jgi:hypothetical protein
MTLYHTAGCNFTFKKLKAKKLEKKKIFFVCVLKVTNEKKAGSGARSVIKR